MYYHFLSSPFLVIWPVEFYGTSFPMGVQRKVLMAAAFCLSCMKFREVQGTPARAPNQPCPLPLPEGDTWCSEWWSVFTQAKRADVLARRYHLTALLSEVF